MNKKKKLPLRILKSLEPFVNLSGDKFKAVDPKEMLLRILDIDNTSDFYFIIENYQKKQNGSFQLMMNRKPKNENEQGNVRAWIEVKNLEEQFQTWLTLLSSYENVNSFFDDPIIKANADKFFQKFEILDKKSEIESFDLEQQLFLDEYLNFVKGKLKELKANQSDEKVGELEILEIEVEEIRSALTLESKKKIMLRLSKFLGRAQKTGLEVIKEIFINIASEVATRLLMGR